MSSLFRRPSATTTCFYCQLQQTTPVPPHTTFLCQHCACWNRFDGFGQILSDEPAMHDELLNVPSFSRRASPNRNLLPSTFNKSLFCRSCQTNQTLIVNLLSNYLPSTEDPNYASLLARLPEYERSLQERYPPVCKNCLPAVEEEIRKKDYMAKTNALGSRLKESQGSKAQGSRHPPPKWQEIWMWRFRGIMWIASYIISILYNIHGYRGRECFMPFLLPPVILLSLFWTFWDPTWERLQRARLQGRELRVIGRDTFIRSQMLIWAARLGTSVVFVSSSSGINTESFGWQTRAWFTFALLLEIALGPFSFISLQLRPPAIVRLSSATPTIPSTPKSTPVADPDPLFSTLSLSDIPVTPPSNSIFGAPALFAPPPAPLDTDDAEPMDWTPASGSPLRQRSAKEDQDDNWLRPQRFFAPEQPTGLEGLFERTRISEDIEVPPSPASSASISRGIRQWAAIGGSILTLVAGLVLWDRQRMTMKPMVTYGPPNFEG